MDEQLKNLGKTAAPPPRETARRQALAAAMRSFDDAAGKNSHATQGTRDRARLSHIATSIWSSIMKQRWMTTSALATLLIVPVAGYMAFQLSEGSVPLGQTPPPSETNPAKTEVASAETKAKQVLAKDGSAGADGEGIAAGDGVVVEQQENKRRADEAVAVAPPAPASTVALAEQMAAAPAPAAEPMADETFRVRGGAQAPALLGRQLNQALATDAAKPIIAEGDYSTQLPDLIPVPEGGQDRVQAFDTNPVKTVAEAPVSTFSADVDTASYAMVRRSLKQGMLPDAGSVRVEELVNYFPYDWKGPDSAETPFKATVTVTPTPWNAGTKLLHVAVKGYDVKPAARPKANLVFLIDVSGSMDEPDKLPLLKSSFRLLVDKLQPTDTISIVTYAGEAGTVLEPTKVAEKAKILDAMDRLAPGGSTAGAAGIEEAYRLAEQAFIKDGVNRVMLATDGDFNVGPASDEELKTLIETKRKSGVFLSVFGFGEGNYNDQMMQVIAQNGNGVAAYVDTLSEAEKTLVQEATASLFPIASDVKFQIEFNPAVIAEYRQIGFETRALNREDFNNDAVDAGEIGSGHTVTAIYEITPVGSPAILNANLRYAEKKPATVKATDASASNEIAFLKMRAKTPGQPASKLTEMPVTSANEVSSFETASSDVRFSIAVAAFGQKLRGTSQVSQYSWDSIEDMAAGARGEDPYGYRGEFLSLVRLAKGLK